MRPRETQSVIGPEKTMGMSRIDRETTMRELLKARARYLNEMESARRRAKRDAARPGKRTANRRPASPPRHGARH